MFPNRIRAPALAVSAGVEWITAFAVTMTFPGLLSTVGLSGIFSIYAIASIGAYWTVFRHVRETKGIVLEDMPDVLRANAVIRTGALADPARSGARETGHRP